MVNIKILVNAITASRIVGSIIFLIIGFGAQTMADLPFEFFAIYIWCVISDLIDGPISRKTKVTSNFGALHDSIADLVMIVAALVVFLPMFATDPTFTYTIIPGFGSWIFYVVGFVVAIRVVSMIIGLVKYKTVTLLHTYSSKGAALIMASFPILWGAIGLVPAFSVMAFGQFIASTEEMVINILSKELDRNVTTVFCRKN